MYTLGPSKGALARQARLSGGPLASSHLFLPYSSLKPVVRQPLTWHAPLAIAPNVNRVKLD
jgi:hypothetical protein